MRNPTGNLNYRNILTKHIVFIYLNYFRNGITSQENKHNPAQKWIKAPQPGIKGDLGSYYSWIQGPPWASLDTKLWEPQQQAASDATLPDPLPFSDFSQLSPLLPAFRWPSHQTRLVIIVGAQFYTVSIPIHAAHRSHMLPSFIHSSKRAC